MGRKKKKPVKPWCWYCNREFDDEKVLIYHQKAKHFKCHICHKKLYTAPGLAIHCSQVHKETISNVPNAIPSRDNLEMEIFGMEGVPDEDRMAHEVIKRGRVDDFVPDMTAKKPKLDPASLGMMFPVMPGMGPMMGAARMPVPGMMMPGMPVQPGMMPPLPVAPVSQPLFPSAQASLAPSTSALPNVVSNSNTVTGPRPVFPAYQQAEPASAKGTSTAPTPGPTPPPSSSSSSSSLPPAPLRQVPKVADVGQNCKLMHPEDDISMEELRSHMPKYRTAKAPQQQAPPLNPPPVGDGMNINISALPKPPMVRPGMHPMNPPMQGPIPGNVIRPGMGPPLLQTPSAGPPSMQMLRPPSEGLMPTPPGPPIQQQ